MCVRAQNLPGLKPNTEVANHAFSVVVEEHSMCIEGVLRGMLERIEKQMLA